LAHWDGCLVCVYQLLGGICECINILGLVLVGEMWTLCGLVKWGFGDGPLIVLVWNFGRM
jgi:hypothetical protein